MLTLAGGDFKIQQAHRRSTPIFSDISSPSSPIIGAMSGTRKSLVWLLTACLILAVSLGGLGAHSLSASNVGSINGTCHAPVTCCCGGLEDGPSCGMSCCTAPSPPAEKPLPPLQNRSEESSSPILGVIPTTAGIPDVDNGLRWEPNASSLIYSSTRSLIDLCVRMNT